MSYFSRCMLAIVLICLLIVFMAFAIVTRQTTSIMENERHKAVALDDDRPAFSLVTKDKSIQLPGDFSLQRNYYQDNWYVLANLHDQHGQEYGLIWRFLNVNRSLIPGEGWHNSQRFISKLSIVNAKQSWHEQRLARGGIGQADLLTPPFRLWIDNWHWRSLSAGPLPSQLDITTDNFSAKMHMTPVGPYILAGEDGYLQGLSSADEGTYAVYAPFVSIQGALQLDGQPIPIQGKAWLEKQWGNHPVISSSGRELWLVVSLDAQRSLTIRRQQLTKDDAVISGAVLYRNGEQKRLSERDVQLTPIATTQLENGKTLPLIWRLEIAEHDISLTLTPLNHNLWSDSSLPDWHGPILTEGSHSARGFMRLSGY